MALTSVGAYQIEGEGIQLLLWQLGEDIHALAGVLDRVGAGTPLSAALRTAHVWGKRQGALERAAHRVQREAVAPMLRALARLDALGKGLRKGNAWDELRTLALALAGVTVVPLPAGH